MDYLMYAYLQLAQDSNATALRDELREFQGGPANAGTAYGFAASPARYALERNAWAEAVALPLHPEAFPWSQFPEAEAVTHFARGLGAARSGNAGDARQAAERLAALHDALTERGQDYWAEQVDIQRQVLVAWTARAEGRNQEALALLRAAAAHEATTEKDVVTPGPIAPAGELLGELLLELGQPVAALAAFEAMHAVEPNRFKGLYGAARAAQQAGEHDRARSHYTQLLALARGADGDRPQLQEARAYLQTR
jgi:tetratricopeptide (TPR) repeat protein